MLVWRQRVTVTVTVHFDGDVVGVAIPFWNSAPSEIVVGARAVPELINRPVGRVTHPYPEKLIFSGYIRTALVHF